jgi:hypothetical protein
MGVWMGPARLLRLIPVLACVAAACSSQAPAPRSSTPSPSADQGLSQPYPYTRPTPPPQATPVDGIYERSVTEREAGPPGPCRRCPPYRLEIGEATLSLEKGVFRLTNDVRDPNAIDWRSVGHYEVSGEEIVFFNDPNCTKTRGSYRWSQVGRVLSFEVIDDECAFGGLRWRYLSALPWNALSP